MFLYMETRETMMHVSSMLPFSPPPDAPPDHLRRLMDEIRASPIVHRPFNLKLRTPELLVNPLQAWVEDRDVDLEYHVRRSALPSPGDERELGILVSRLHGQPIDFHRPPWEVHLIEGLEGGRFALYVKVHHALVDGYSAMKILASSLSHDASDRTRPLFFSLEEPARVRSDGESGGLHFPELLAAVRAQVGTSKSVLKALVNMARSSRSRELVSPLHAPTSILNRRISRNRRFATQSFETARMRAVAKAANGTLNDVILAICAASLRKYLGELDALPDAALVAMVPVNVRPKDDAGGGNAVGAILASLATDVADPSERLEAIIASTRRAKEQLQGMSKAAIIQYSALLTSPFMLQLLPGAMGRVRPVFNLVISNVPGPEQPLYFRGARLEAAYPMSIPVHGLALNITCNSYAGTLDFGFIGCRDTLPHLQRLAVHAGDALPELERAIA
ncbi:MAG: Wax ester synthase/acyl-CoA:diacylglycerol acyltransferase [Myxococcales bacterium]|nr:Wax ester synthase/acyl-CoA:diacylglycerol acyltransferase [Myxococcales bacterium]